MNYLDALNTPQKAAVTCGSGPMMVIAGPGSGKTRVLTYRLAYLIQSGILPWQILALTFTNKSAREMKSRIEAVVGRDANKVWAGTFHSTFARILRVEATKLGYPGSFSIYDTDDTKNVIKDVVSTLGLDPKVYKPGPIYNRISSAKSSLITAQSYQDNPELMEIDQFQRRPMIYKIYDKYTERLHKAGAMDFDDLLLNMYRLLHENPDNVLEKYRRQFAYVLVDEFQDTNHLQYAIVKLLVDYPDSPRNVCVVGDDAQSIYSFRGATIENILQFESDFPDVQVFKLEQNYRSTSHIVQAANNVIGHNPRQIKKDLWTSKATGQKIKLIRALSDSEEGRKVVSTIIELKNRQHLSNSDIALLYRTNAQSRIFEEYLRRQNINYRIFGGLSFYQRKEVKDLLAYLRLTVNHKDDEALKRAITTPKRGIGATSLQKLMTYAQANGLSAFESIWQIGLSSRTQSLFAKFAAMIQNFAQYAQSHDAYRTALHIYNASGLKDLYREDDTLEGLGRLENLEALLDGIQDFVDSDEVDTGLSLDKSLSAYLQNIALMTDQDQDNDEDADYVTLMSVHAAKGLEYKAVFVVGVEENLFPSFMSMDSQEAIDEERRLFYVAITRAEDYLILSHANSRYQYGQFRSNERSRFIQEIDLEHFEHGAEEAHRASSDFSRTLSASMYRPTNAASMPTVDSSGFKAASPSQIAAGQRVRHLKFGDGQVIHIDGTNHNKVATIRFDQIDNPERRIMLKFAKLMIVD